MLALSSNVMAFAPTMMPTMAPVRASVVMQEVCAAPLSTRLRPRRRSAPKRWGARVQALATAFACVLAFACVEASSRHSHSHVLPSLSVLSSQRDLMPGFQDAATVEKDAEAAKAAGEFCYGLPGSIAPFERFDPFNLLEGKTFEQVRTWREAELAHARVGMLAAAGFLVQEKFHPLFSGDGGPAVDQIPRLPVAIWFLMTLGIGACEALRIQVGWSNPNSPDHVFQKLLPDYVPGDIGFDPLGLKPEDPEEFRIMQTKELQNGRLGMIAAAGFLAQEAVTDQTWGTYWGLPDF